MINKLTVVLGWGLILLFACAHKPKLQTQLTPEIMPLYRLGYGDVVEIKFFDNQRFSREITVRPDGRITLEKIGDIYVSGLTTQELDSIVTIKYKDILKSPDVTVFLKNFGNQKVYVMGEVNSPGGYLIERDMTTTHAIALAGGYKRSANLKSVLLIRKAANGKVNAKRVNLRKVLSAKSNAEDDLVQALDIIYVPKTFIANIDNFIDQFFNILLPPVDVFWRLWFIEQATNY